MESTPLFPFTETALNLFKPSNQMEPLVSIRSLLFFFIFFFFSAVVISPVRSGDSEALLALKSTIDPSNSLSSWLPPTARNVCDWEGVKQCLNGRVTKLVVEFRNLTGVLDAKILNRLDQLRVLSFKSNSISGRIPDLSGLVNLKSLFLNQNNFSGGFPESVTLLHRLKVVVLAGNALSGPIPNSLVGLDRLYVLYLEENQFTGSVPPLGQTSLRYFNVSDNNLSGSIPATPALVRFNSSSFSGNAELCGEQIGKRCSDFSPSPSPGFLAGSKSKNRHRRSKLIKIIAPAAGGLVTLILISAVILVCLGRRKGKSTAPSTRSVPKGGDGGGGSFESGGGGSGTSGNNGGRQGGFSWERGEGIGTLVFLGAGDQIMSYSLEDLLKASAETLGRGTMGSTYKAVMESGFIVTVKRLKDARYPRVEEFRRQMEVIGRLRHPNLVPLRAYFQAKEERLLVYDYFPNGSLFSLLHGTRASGGGKPLHWTSCLKIAEDLATGILYIHQNPGLAHGNLKSSNVLLGPDFESCLTDFGLAGFQNPDSPDEPSAVALFYRAPEVRDVRKPPTQPSDVYSFGVLLLELLTGKTPFQDLVQEHGSDIPRWVRSVREEETDSGDDPVSSGNEAEEKLQALVGVAMLCVSRQPENRPAMREARSSESGGGGGGQVSSNSNNSSDHSPGRWSDTVQSLPREEHLSI
ncbi:Inactive leucine-rich repeat receptor-like serine/threonine-protein kinase At1g60630 [Linum grandiflorum]